jgi:hypothetical protein
MKNRVVIALVLVAIVILLFILTRDPSEPKDLIRNTTALNYSNIFFNYKVIRYPTDVEITPPESNMNVGVVTDPWNLDFGNLPGNGSYVKRYIGISNLKESYNRITIKPYGNITSLLNFSKNDFTLKENESVAVEVDMYTDSAKFGNYSGEIDVIIKVPKYNFLRMLL